MQEHLFEIFCLRLAMGLVLALLVLPLRTVSARFYRIQFLIVLGLAVAAGMFAWHSAGEWFWLGLGLACAACLIGSVFWSAEGVGLGVGSILVAVAGFLSCLSDLAFSVATRTIPWALSQDVAAALFLGLATTAMLMGHWYLIAPTMSLAPLRRLLQVFFLALGLRILTAGIDLAMAFFWAAEFDGPVGIWIALRWGVGLLGAGVLGVMAWKSAEIRSTQSATGILYVVVIFCFMGELVDQLLQSHWLERGSA
jgi:hypothetical protein